MGIFGKFFGKKRQAKIEKADRRAAIDAVTKHLEDFLTSRKGVEIFIEQPTNMTKASILLVAHDGEWTRRQVPSVEWAREFADYYELPSYDAGIVGYPQRMRDYNQRQKRERKSLS